MPWMGAGCCQGNCLIFEDAFTRGDSSDPGSGWDEISGDWAVSGYQLKEAGTSGAIVATKKEAPTAPCLAYADLPQFDVGDANRIIIHYVDEDNYHYGQLERTSDIAERLSVGEVVGGVEEELDAVTTNGGMSATAFYVCAAKGSISAHHITDAAWECVGDNGGRKAGLGNAGTTEVHFDNFRFERHKADKIICNACICTCEGFCISKELVATIHSVTGDDPCVACLEGLEIPLDYDYGEFVIGFAWKGDADPLIPQPDCYDGTQGELDLELWCGGQGATVRDWEDWQLAGPAAWGISPFPAGTNPISGSCDPFFLTFGPLYHVVDGVFGPTCFFYLTITERP